MKRTTQALLAALTLMAVPTMGGAQSVPDSSRDPILWTGREVEYEGETLTLRNEVELVQGENRLRANQVSGLRHMGGDSRLEATGDVYFVTPEQTIRGDRAVYNTAEGIIVVTGDVILTQGRNVASGGRLTYNVRTGSARFDSPGSSGRIQGVFYPQD